MQRGSRPHGPVVDAHIVVHQTARVQYLGNRGLMRSREFFSPPEDLPPSSLKKKKLNKKI